MTQNNHIIKAQALEKTFGTTKAVRGACFNIEQGKCVGLLGPNGAGKTTTMRMIMGLTTPSSGALDLFGTPVAKLTPLEQARIGLVPQENNLDQDLSVVQNLQTYGRYFGLPKTYLNKTIPALLEFMQLTAKKDAAVFQLSGGMKRRLVLARALIADPDVVILDEPTTGLDPQARVMIWQLLTSLKNHGKTLLLTTHYMDEAERLCDEIIIIDEGKILDKGTPQELIKRHVAHHVIELQKPVAPKILEKNKKHEDLGDSYIIYTNTPSNVTLHISKQTPYLQRPANLEDVFLCLTGRQLKE